MRFNLGRKVWHIDSDGDIWEAFRLLNGYSAANDNDCDDVYAAISLKIQGNFSISELEMEWA